MRIIPLLTTLLLCAWPAWGMDYLHALSQIETGDNDHVVGKHMEVTRVQMLPKIWKQYKQPGDSTRDSAAAYRAAAICWNERITAFAEKFRRQPTPFESYRLWNSPTAVMQGLPATPAVKDRATRFANLVTPNDTKTVSRSSTNAPPGLRITNSVSIPNRFIFTP